MLLGWQVGGEVKKERKKIEELDIEFRNTFEERKIQFHDKRSEVIARTRGFLGNDVFLSVSHPISFSTHPPIRGVHFFLASLV